MKIENIKISLLEPNKGQIEGLPKNPRFIRDERYKALIKSIEDAPEMLSLRELIVYPHNGKYVAVCGNMRLRACSEIGYKELPCKVLPTETPVEKLREYAIKDNNGFGQDDWSILNTEWDLDELSDWCMECDGMDKLDDIEGLFDEETSIKTKESRIIVCVPEENKEDMSKIIELIKQSVKDYPNIEVK